MLEKFEGAGDREAAVALMRNCLTHPEASRIMRDEVMWRPSAASRGPLDGETPRCWPATSAPA
jgi:hypothetical protein